MTKKTTGRGFGAKKIPNKTSSNILDRFANRLARLSRGVRILLAALIAIILTAIGAIVVYTYLDTLQPDLVTSNLRLVVLTALTIVGAGLYYIGWRILVGFDVPDAADPVPFQPGRAGAIWVIVGVTILFIVILVEVFNTIQAIGPA